ncbi:MAG: recombinase family protein, partial [Rhodobacteraceae bacterium]|nr:recombinase family protein [Paracoccaceae bacterium]
LGRHSGASEAAESALRTLPATRNGAHTAVSAQPNALIRRSYDQPSRSLDGPLSIVARLWKKGAGLRSPADDIETTMPVGNFVFNLFVSIAESERERFVEWTRARLAAARTRGRIGGRPTALSLGLCRQTYAGCSRPLLCELGKTVQRQSEYCPSVMTS